MDKQTDILKAVRQHLEIDEFFTGNFGVKGDGLAEIEIEAEAAVENQVSEPQAEQQSESQAVSEAASSEESKGAVQAGDLSVASVAEKAVSAENQVEAFVSEVSNDREAGMVDVDKELAKIAAEIDKCRACELGESRLNTVPGEGSSKADIVFVGEAPGAEEDKSGEPFVGRAGKLLTKIIEAMGVTREDVYICNTLKCRPPGNRDPKPSEKAACRHFLHAQLRLINPKIIVALGSHAAKELLQTDKPIGQLRGKFHDYHVEGMDEPIKVMPTYHPSYLLRNYNVDSRRRVWLDMQKVMEELGLPVPKKKQSLK